MVDGWTVDGGCFLFLKNCLSAAAIGSTGRKFGSSSRLVPEFFSRVEEKDQ
jgi:hypothetical protein